MESSSRSTQATVAADPVPLLAELPLLIALALAPVTAGSFEPLPALLLACLVWVSALLRLLMPGVTPLRRPSGWRMVAGFLLVALLPLAGAVVVSAIAKGSPDGVAPPVVAALGAITPGATILWCLIYASLAAALWLAADITARGGAERLIAAALVGGLLAGGIALQQYLVELKAGNASWRSFGTFANPNFLAGGLVPLLLLTLGLSPRRPEAFKPGMWLLVLSLLTATLTAGIVATGSRGGLLTLGGGLFVFLVIGLMRGTLRAREPLVRVGILLAVLALVALPLLRVVGAREGASANAPATAGLCAEEERAASADSNEFRVLTWRGTLAMVQSRPVLGWGAGSYETAFGPFMVAGYTRHAHQGYLQLAAELGVVGLALWLGLLALGMGRLHSMPRDEEHPWVAGVAAALIAGAAHNLLDSIWFVPATALLTWVLLGIALAPQGASEAEAAPASRAGSRPRSRQPIAAVIAVLLLAITGWHAVGRSLLNTGRGLVESEPKNAVETLQSAASFLPWDYQVHDRLRRALLNSFRFDEAQQSGQRAIHLAPERAAGYSFLGQILSGSAKGAEEQIRARLVLELGLKHVPNDVQLWYELARVLQTVGEPREVERAYRRIAELEDSPVGRVRALAEVRDYRFARARMELARIEEGARQPDAAFAHRSRAACLLSARRRLYEGNPAAYEFTGETNPRLEQDLRQEERTLWEGISREYRRRGDAEKAVLASKEVEAVDASWGRLQEAMRPQEGG